MLVRHLEKMIEKSFQYENILVFCLGVSVSCAVWRNIKSLNMVSIEFHEMCSWIESLACRGTVKDI